MSSTESFVPFAIPDITEAEIEAAVSAMRSGWLTTGPNAAAFEAEFAAFLGPGLTAVAVNSATAGLHLAVEALGLGPGDEVLVPTWTFTATAEVVRYVGATPVFVDCDPSTLNLDFNHAETLVNERTRAIIPVHFAGRPIPSSILADFSDSHHLQVIEDAAHAFPVVEGGRFVGAGDSAATVFSFYATKTMTTGEGGMLVTRDAALAQRARVMRLHGISRDVFDRYQARRPSWQYEVVAPGFKYNMTDIAAAIGRVQLARAEEMRRKRADIVASYKRAIADLPLESLRGREDEPHAHHLFVVKLSADSPIRRDDLISRLAAHGVGASVHFIPLHLQPYWRDTYGLRPDAFPAATNAFEQVVSLPLFSAMTQDQLERVIDALKSSF